MVEELLTVMGQDKWKEPRNGSSAAGKRAATIPVLVLRSEVNDCLVLRGKAVVSQTSGTVWFENP